MKQIISALITGFLLVGMACTPTEKNSSIAIYQTSASGDQLTPVEQVDAETSYIIVLDTTQKKQVIQGFGGAFTESTCYLLNQISDSNRNKILTDYFGSEGAEYSLCRTHMNSSDFSLGSYSYATVENDTNLTNFSVEEDQDDIIPAIQQAQKISETGFNLIASPWTAPPWMKDNNAWFGGSLKKEYYPTWALFFSKYAKAYEQNGIDIWAFTIENEPIGNNSSWESMHYTPEQMSDFVKNHLAPQLNQDSIDAKLLMYDQNKGEELIEWASVYLKDEELLPYIYGTAVHWYNSTFSYFPESLQKTHELAPSKHIIHTEACIDADVPAWKDDSWYWSNKATDWGYTWAKEENKHMHPPYIPAHRYARDIIGGLNNHVEGWVDWNMVLNKQGGPNHVENWCGAPILVDPETDQVYTTPIYYVMAHFSKFLRPGDQVIDHTNPSDNVMVAAATDSKGNIKVVLFNEAESAEIIQIKVGEQDITTKIKAQAIQTILISI